LKGTTFNEELALFGTIRQSIPENLQEYFRPLAIRPYLNKDDNKEFELLYES